MSFNLPAPLRAFALSIPIQGLSACIVYTLQPYIGLLPAFVLWVMLGYLLAKFLYLPTSWQVLNAGLGPLAVLSVLLDIPAHFFALGATVLALIFLPTLWTRVPYYPSQVEVYAAVAQQLPTNKNFTFIDVGSGFAGMLRYLATRFPEAHFVGMELALLPYLVSKVRARSFPNLEIRWQNFWQEPLADYDFIYAFLAPPPMPRLFQKFMQQAKPQAVCLVNSFPLPGKPQAIIELSSAPRGNGRQQVLYVYRRDKQVDL
jgi:hypothetical protein